MRVNETFLSLQGEGHFTGVPAFFLRLSGCNLCCSFCDTNHRPYTEMSEEEIVAAAQRSGVRHIVITGGEPGLQLTSSMVKKLHEAGFFIQVETNGTQLLPEGIDWVTCSPKIGLTGSGIPVLTEVHELKLLYGGDGTDLSVAERIVACEYRLQPLDTGDAVRNREILSATVDYILKHPQWALSLQTHKLLSIQ